MAEFTKLTGARVMPMHPRSTISLGAAWSESFTAERWRSRPRCSKAARTIAYASRPMRNALARAALAFVEPGMSVMLDDFTTSLARVRSLADHLFGPFTAVTQYLPSIHLLCEFADVNLIGVGGDYSPPTIPSWVWQRWKHLGPVGRRHA